MECKYCGSKMRLDDVDFNFKGNKDNYYLCDTPDCNSGCIEKIRYGKPFSQDWHKETGYEILDEYIKI